jgi:hypothetical protein
MSDDLFDGLKWETEKPAPPETVEIENSTFIDSSGRKRPKLHGKTEKVLNLAVNHGVAAKDAFIFVNGKPPSAGTLTSLKDKIAKYSLTAPGMVKLAHNALRDTLKGKEYGYDAVKILGNGEKIPYTEKIIPSYTNKLAAASMVFDRVEPIINRNVNLNINAEVDPVDLSEFTV